MDESKHGQNETPSLCLTDLLALERTSLANERTLLAYIRTSLSIVVAGLSFIKFFGMVYLSILGYFLVPAGTTLFFFGLYKYYAYKKEIVQKK